jgi:hypothetical protein
MQIQYCVTEALVTDQLFYNWKLQIICANLLGTDFIMTVERVKMTSFILIF